MTALVQSVRQRSTIVSAGLAAAGTLLAVNLVWRLRVPQAAWLAAALVGVVSLMCWAQRSARPLAIGVMIGAFAQTAMIVALIAGGRIS